MSGARFKIRNVTLDGEWSLFADAGFDAEPGDEIELQLEDTPALDIWQTVFTCEDRSAGRAAPTFDPSSGEAATPTSAVSMTLPASERGAWWIQCQTNGGEAALDAQGRPDLTVHTKARIVAVRTENLGLRHPLAGETTQYDPQGSVVALQEMLDEVDDGAGGGGGSGVVSSPGVDHAAITVGAFSEEIFICATGPTALIVTEVWIINRGSSTVTADDDDGLLFQVLPREADSTFADAFNTSTKTTGEGGFGDIDVYYTVTLPIDPPIAAPANGSISIYVESFGGGRNVEPFKIGVTLAAAP
jgi:hypothetical protein